MKYLRVFETTSEQQSYLTGDMITPNITITRNNESTIHYVPEVNLQCKIHIDSYADYYEFSLEQNKVINNYLLTFGYDAFINGIPDGFSLTITDTYNRTFNVTIIQVQKLNNMYLINMTDNANTFELSMYDSINVGVIPEFYFISNLLSSDPS